MKQTNVIFAEHTTKGSDRIFRFARRRAPVRADGPKESSDDSSDADEDEASSQQEEQKLRALTDNSQHLLLKCSTVFPFDFFPDTIAIEASQVNIFQKTFFLTQHLLTIPIKNISDIHVQTSIFFASLTFIDRSFADNTIQINWLRKDDAFRIRKIVQGLIIATSQDIKVGKVDPKVLKAQTEKLGNMHQLE